MTQLVGQLRLATYTIRQKLESSQQGEGKTANLVHPECHTSHKTWRGEEETLN